jgi:diadenylate cyclase
MFNGWGTIFHTFRIQDFFDIAIVGILIYALLVWFKKTASRFVLIGIILLGAVYTLSNVLHLYLTVEVLQGFFAILLIALVVIFQEELRRFFEKLAVWGRLRKRTVAPSQHQVVEIIAQACANLARKRNGALFVISGEEPLERHLEGCIRLEGMVSQPLLESIFDPHSLGHDGAVIINQGLVSQFGCHLPLSLNTHKLENLGLRHTAALGISERSDALCIVISEERGTISVAREGTLKVLANATELRQTLEEFYEHKAPRERASLLSDWWKRNSLEKAIAVFLACVLWIIFGYQKESVRRDFVVPVEYRNVAPDWEIESGKITGVKVMLMGSEQAFRLLDPNILKLSLDLSTIVEGKQTVAFTKEMINTPSNLTVVGLQPDQTTIVASKLVPLNASIKVKTTGELDPNLILQRMEVDPASIEVLAPRKIRKTGITIQTEPVDLGKLTHTTTLYPKLVLPSEVRFVGEKPPTVKLTCKILNKSSKASEDRPS